MENEILESIKHIKNISKKKATIEKIFSYVKKRNVDITNEEVEQILDGMITSNLLVENGKGASRSFLIPEEAIVPDTQEIPNSPNNNISAENMILDETILEPPNQESADNIYENILIEIKNFKKFQDDVEKKFCSLEDAIERKDASRERMDNSPGLVVNILKHRISCLESELKSKDTIIEFLTKQLLSSSQKSQMEINNNNLEETFSSNKSIINNEFLEESSFKKDKTKEQKKRVVITGDSMLNGIHEKGLSKNHTVKINNFPGGTSETVLENIDETLKSKPDCLIVHAGTNDLTNGINLLNQAKKIVKQVKKVSQNTKIVLSSIITRKDRKNIDKKVSEVNSYLKNYCSQKNIDFIDNSNLKEEHLGQKKLHLNKKGNSILAKKNLKFLRSNF